MRALITLGPVGVKLAKGNRLTDWLQRPLKPEQLSRDVKWRELPRDGRPERAGSCARCAARAVFAALSVGRDAAVCSLRAEQGGARRDLFDVGRDVAAQTAHQPETGGEKHHGETADDEQE